MQVSCLALQGAKSYKHHCIVTNGISSDATNTLHYLFVHSLLLNSMYVVAEQGANNYAPFFAQTCTRAVMYVAM